MSHYKLGKKCLKCGSRLLDKNKTGFCNKHRDRTGKNNPFFGKHHSKETIEKSRPKLSSASKKLWQKKEYRDKVIKGVSKPRREGFKAEQSARVTQWYQDHPEQRTVRSVALRNSWETGKIVFTPHSCNISKGQMKLLEDIRNICSDDVVVETVRDNNGKWLLPDILIKNLGLVIEYYGNFWHADPKRYKADDLVHHSFTAQEIWKRDEERISQFSNVVDSNGKEVEYKVVIVWEDDYKNNRERVLRDLDGLINWESCAL